MKSTDQQIFAVAGTTNGFDVRAGALPNDATALAADAVGVVLRTYGAACQPATGPSI